MINLLLSILNRLGYIIAISFFFTKFKKSKDILEKNHRNYKEIFFLSLFFSVLSIIGTYTGIEYRGALVNTRNIGVAVSGLIGGPIVGIITGIVAGIHRYCMAEYNITTLACSVGTLIGGIISGICHKKLTSKNNYLLGFLLGFFIENLSMILILIFGYFQMQFDIVKDIVTTIYFPMILANSTGSAIVLIMIDDIILEKDLLAGEQAKLALEIANKSLPFFRKKECLNQACEIILKSLGAKVVIITDRFGIIGCSSEKECFELKNRKIQSEATKKVLKTGELLILGIEEDSSLNFNYINKKIRSCIILPLFQGGNQVSGTLKLYFDTSKKSILSKKYLAEGLSTLISTQMELGKIENLEVMAKEAELKALQSQINPHFLFNVLNTISSFVRIDGDKAREIILDFSTYLRYNLENSSKFVTIRMELEQVNSYINIEKSRFGDKIKVKYEIEEEVLDMKIPSLTIQPLVENSIKHGILKKKDGGEIHIKIVENKDNIEIVVKDDGVGIEEEIIKRLDTKIDKNIGLKNVHNRLKLLYNKGLIIERINDGTQVRFFIPKEGYDCYKKHII